MADLDSGAEKLPLEGDGKMLGILVCGNIEWEVIMPEKGPLVYNDFIARRGIGFHHVLMEIPQAKWAQRL
ncbi:MAG: hypothetical protein IJQ27_00055, partial [Spirochaetia bacterium]|nr:hypothetical protein [Spirochaetia bacterium]